MGAALIYQQYQHIREKYPDLHLKCSNSGIFWVEGRLTFVGTYHGETIEDTYSVKILIPEDYPHNHPTAQETGSRIPKDFHHYVDNSLCLGARFAIRKAFLADPTLLGFTEHCLIPYLYSFSYKTKHGRLPFGELSHGLAGVLEYYRDQFQIQDDKAALGLLHILAGGKFGGHGKCPCGSGKRIRDCHGNLLEKMAKIQPPNAFQSEYSQLVDWWVREQGFQRKKRI